MRKLTYGIAGTIIIFLGVVLLIWFLNQPAPTGNTENSDTMDNEKNVNKDKKELEKPELTAETADIVVDTAGNGDFLTVQAAIDSIPEDHAEAVKIFIKSGTYKEKINIEKPQIQLYGENKDDTILVYNDYNGKEILMGTRESASVSVHADDFYAENLTFKNSTEYDVQAVALYLDADRAEFHNVRVIGNQDTLYVNQGRHYFKDSYIEGTTDFIFGGATAVFEDCVIHSKKASYITAANTFKEQKYGIVFIDCKLTSQLEENTVYLGRPWDSYANVMYINTWMGAHIKPEGWHNWGDPKKEATVRYAEYNSTGPGAAPEQRVAWSSQLTAAEAEKLTPENILSGEDGWNPKANQAK